MSKVLEWAGVTLITLILCLTVAFLSGAWAHEEGDSHARWFKSQTMNPESAEGCLSSTTSNSLNSAPLALQTLRECSKDRRARTEAPATTQSDLEPQQRVQQEHRS